MVHTSHTTAAQPAALPPAPVVVASGAIDPTAASTVPVTAANVLSWDRAYVGLGGGLSRTSNRVYAGNFHSAATAVATALELGRRWQRGRLVTGLELQGVLTSPVNLYYASDTPIYQPRGYVSVKGQLGWDSGPILIYATGGAQFTSVHFAPAFRPDQMHQSPITTSFLYGAGLVVPIANDFSIDLEATATSSFDPLHLIGAVNSQAHLVTGVVGIQLGF